jgi:hypothetical protein
MVGAAVLLRMGERNAATACTGANGFGRHNPWRRQSLTGSRQNVPYGAGGDYYL